MSKVKKPKGQHGKLQRLLGRVVVKSTPLGVTLRQTAKGLGKDGAVTIVDSRGFVRGVLTTPAGQVVGAKSRAIFDGVVEKGVRGGVVFGGTERDSVRKRIIEIAGSRKYAGDAVALSVEADESDEPPKTGRGGARIDPLGGKK